MAKITISTRDAILKVLYHVEIKYNVTYSQVKRSTLKKLMFQFYKIDRCLSTIDYHLRNLKKSGLINNYPRKGQDENGRWFNKASNRQIIGKGLNYLKDLGIKVKTYLIDWAFSGIKPIPRRNIKPASLSDQLFPKPSGRSATTPEDMETILSNAISELS